MTRWTYIISEPGLYTVGFYSPAGDWHPDSDHNDRETAGDRVHWLNGGQVSSERKPEPAEGATGGTTKVQ